MKSISNKKFKHLLLFDVIMGSALTVLTQNVYKSKKLGSYSNINDPTKLEYQHDLTYFIQCPGVNSNETYLGETAIRLQERVLEHARKDRKSNMVIYGMDTGHPLVCMIDFQILTKGFNHCKFQRKLYEALLIKKYQPAQNNT